MTTQQPDWQAYLAQMESVLGVTLDDARRAELQVQFSRIANMAAPLMALPLDDRLEIAGIDTLRREKRPLPPLAGVPYAVKNLFDVAGHTTLAGAELFSQRPAAAADSFAVRQLRSAGGLLTGMVNMDAYAYGFTTENSHYGTTRNPHDLARIAGGSSGGSAAAVAAGLVHFSLGTDTNGSIRREPRSYRPLCPPRVRPGVRLRCAAGAGQQRRFSGRELARADAPPARSRA